MDVERAAADDEIVKRRWQMAAEKVNMENATAYHAYLLSQPLKVLRNKAVVRTE
jgi:hypothetical protein